MQTENETLRKNYIARIAPGQPPVVTTLPPNSYAPTINTATIGKHTADVNSLYSAQGAFGTLINKVDTLKDTVQRHDFMAHINRPDYDLLGCRATQAIMKFELQMEKNQSKYGSDHGW